MEPKNNQLPKRNFIERGIAFFSPKIAFERERYRQMQNIMASEVRKFDAAGSGRRLSNWTVHNTTSTQELRVGLTAIRARSRDLVRNNPYAARAIKGIANNVVGVGIRPSIVANSDSAKRNIKMEWDKWAGSKDCDFDGKNNLYGLQKLAMRSIAESGEVLILKKRYPKNKIPIQLQVVEADYIDTNKNLIGIPGQPTIIMGVEFDADGRRSAIWVYDRDQYEFPSAKSIRIPLTDVLHLFEVLRPGQVRGIPFGVSSFVRMRDFDGYEDAQLVRQKIAACFSVFVSDSADLFRDKRLPDYEEIERVEPGIIQKLAPGSTVTMASPPPAEGYKDYSSTILRSISAGYGTTYELMTGDYSQVNFSSGRMGWLDMRLNVEDLQELMLVPQMCDEVFKWFLEAGYISGTIRNINNVTATWTPPRREMINPFQEIKALIEQIRAGLISQSEALRQMGFDPDVTLDEIEDWVKTTDDKKLKFSTDYRTMMKQPSSTPPTSENN